MEFTGDSSLASVAAELWPHVVACAGEPNPNYTGVHLETGTTDPGVGGHIARGPPVARITVRTGDTDPETTRVIAHELGHLWAHGHYALAEGKAEYIAECAFWRSGLGALVPDRAIPGASLSRVMSWRAPTADIDDRYQQTVLGRRLFTALGVLLPDVPMSYWDVADDASFLRTLEHVDADGSVRRQLSDPNALADQDGDGWPSIVESVRGTNPERADSDGDSRWDSAEMATFVSIIVPLDASLVCSGVRSGGTGNIRAVPVAIGIPVADIVVHTSNQTLVCPVDGCPLPPETELLVIQSSQVAPEGAQWLRLDDAELVETPRCLGNETMTLWSTTTAPIDMSGIASCVRRLPAELGLPERRISLGIADDCSNVTIPCVADAPTTPITAELADALSRNWIEGGDVTIAARIQQICQ